MKKKKWAVDPDRKIGWIMEFMKKYLKLDRSEQLVIFTIRNHTSNSMRNRPFRTQFLVHVHFATTQNLSARSR
jgi:hypothetical protein